MGLLSEQGTQELDTRGSGALRKLADSHIHEARVGPDELDSAQSLRVEGRLILRIVLPAVNPPQCTGTRECV